MDFVSDRKTVMISSTARDLPDHREQVRLACQRLGFEPREMMENLPALDSDAVEVSLRMVEQADVYICILANRYGFIPDGRDISITEMEYNRAVELDKPRLVFFSHKDRLVVPDDVETGPGADKLKALKERIGQQRVAASFTSPEDLRAHAGEALFKLGNKLKAAESNIASASTLARLHRESLLPVPPAPYIAHPYTLMQVRELVGRQDEFNLMTDWITNPDSEIFNSCVFCFVAIGGMGKSAVTWKWFKEVAPEKMKPLAGLLWWSFYESDASFENFLVHALCYVSGQSNDAVRALSRREREVQLLHKLSEKPYLFVLDGMERILIAYHRMDASYLTDDEFDRESANYVAGAAGLQLSAAQSYVGQHRLRQTTDPRDGRYLKELVEEVTQSRILITTRLYPSELQLPNGNPRPGCFAYFLPGLSDDDAFTLWRGLGVSGSRSELVSIFRSAEHHPLLVQTLASEVANYRKAPGDFHAWRQRHWQFDPTSLVLKQTRTHILEFALSDLESDVREVLHTLVGFRMPTNYATLEALLVGANKTYKRFQQLDRALTELEDRGLIGWDREANRYDAHPIVRGVVWRIADNKDRQAVYAAINSYFEPIVTPNEDKINSLEELAPAIERYHTLVGLQRYDDAFHLFRDRLARPTLYRLSAHRERIGWLEALFPEGLEELPALTSRSDQSLALTHLAQSYQASGAPGRSVSLKKRSLEIDERQRNELSALYDCRNLGNVLRETGALQEAAGYFRRSYEISRHSDGSFEEAEFLRFYGRFIGVIGDHKLSQIALKRSQQMFANMGNFNLEGVLFSYLAERSLWLGEFAEASKLADRAWALAEVRQHERDFVHAALRKGQAAFGLGNLELANDHLHHALTRARAINEIEFELPILVTLAEFDVRLGNLASSKARLDEIWETADRGPYRLHLASAYNVLADVERENDKEAAARAASLAYEAAWCDGPPYAYHWELEKADIHLEALGVSQPSLPPFDRSKFEPLLEVEINPKDMNWVDHRALD